LGDQITDLKVCFVTDSNQQPIRIIKELQEYLELAFRRKQLLEFFIQIGDFQAVDDRAYLLISKGVDGHAEEPKE